MIKHPIPLNPKNAQDKPRLYKSEKPSSSPLKSKEILDCEESIEVISVPLSTFDMKNSFIPEEQENLSDSKWFLSDVDYLQSILSKELEYMSNPYYLQSMQPNLSSSMRAILYDWMMEVCSELTLKRETFHLSVNLCDRYMSLKPNIKKEEYQLIGLTCMYLAGKLEEIVTPSLDDWASSADDGYSKAQIVQAEKLVLRTLDFKTAPGTAFNWTNWLMSQWDSFISFHFSCVPGNNPKDLDQYADKKKVKAAYEERMLFFKQANQKAYKRFRETMQILDIGLLHPGFMKFLPKMIAAGLVYLMVSKFFFESNYALLYYNGDSREALEENIDLNDPFRIECISNVQELYQEFISTAAGVKNIEEIYPTVSFFHPFLEFETSFELPVVCKLKSKAKLESHYEEFLSYQTHNTKNLAFIEENLKNC
jgi:hypothetical protein